MGEIHAQTVADGTVRERRGMDDESYLALLRNIPKDRNAILELGSASGAQWPLLADWLVDGGRIAGIDLYEPLVAEANKLGLPITVGFVEDMPYYANIFDLVCSRHVMEHLGDLDQGMAEILRVTKPGGYIAHVTPNMAVDNEPAHLNHLTETEWVAKWRSFGVDVLFSQRHPFHGGEVHVVGRKQP
jgi:SAM-dependent methyltransferase